ncbi:hypothetical protein ACLB1M_30150 [Escherichia coli]
MAAIASRRCKRIWNIVLMKRRKKHYDDYVMTLYAQGVLTPNRSLISVA